MYGSWIFGSHEAAIQQSQIATSQQIFRRSSAIYNATHILSGGISARYLTGTHREAIEQQQRVSANLLIKSVASTPQTPILRLKRDFPISQEEQPLDSPSSFFIRSTFIPGASIQNPTIRQAIQTFPQESQEQFWSFRYQPPTAPSAAVPTRPPFRVITAIPQQWEPLQVNVSDIFQPVGQSGPAAVSLVPPTILGLEDPGVDPVSLLGTAQLRWSAVPGASAYRVYINGVPQNPPVFGQAFLATGLVVGQQYKFAIVAVAAGIDDSPLSNEIYYEHGLNEFTVVYKYPWGNTFKTGYILKVKLGTPE